MSTVQPPEPSARAAAFEGGSGSGRDALVRWTANLGPGAGLDRVAEYLAAMATALDLAERAAYRLSLQVTAFQIFPAAPRADLPGTPVQPLSELDLGDLLGGPTVGSAPRSPGRVETIELHYENPLSVFLKVPRFLVLPFGGLARMVRDWSADRQRAQARARGMAAQADRAEAEAAAAWADARLRATRADMAQWAAKEIQEGRAGALSAQQLLVLATEADLRALSVLAEPVVTVASEPAA